MKVLVTGAGGFLGRHIARLLIEEGHLVTNFSRKHHPVLDTLGIQTRCGDLADPEAIKESVSGMDAVIHTAAKVGMAGPWREFEKTNVQGTKYLIEACKEEKIKKLVFTSSPSVVYGDRALEGVDESTPYPVKYLCSYARSKAMAEKLILKANCKELATVSLRPHLILGKGDPNLLPKLCEKAKQGRLRRIGDGTNLVDIIHVENAAYAHLLALNNLSPDSPIAGKAYFLGQEKPVSLWPFIDQMLETQGIGPINKAVPASIAYFVGAIIETAWELLHLKGDPPMSRFIAKQLSTSHYFSHAKAKTELGFSPELKIDQILDDLRA